MRIGVAVVLALLELGGAGLADVNGPNYDWWAWTLRALAGVTILVAFLPAPHVPRWTAGVAAAVALAAVVVTTQRFNDSYRGSRAWPDVLAVSFGAAAGAAQVALLARSAATRRTQGPRTPPGDTT